MSGVLLGGEDSAEEGEDENRFGSNPLDEQDKLVALKSAKR